MPDPRRATPRTDVVLDDPVLQPHLQRLGRALVKQTVVEVLERCRAGEVPPEAVVATVAATLPSRTVSVQPVVNATGVVVHTNLGRAPLSQAAQEALFAASGVTDVELDLASGRRGPRGAATLDALRRAVPAAEDVHVVNNGAAALALAACALAQGREIIVSRGELVEIGDGFRIPDLLESVGARLREVGTTNRVRIEDYDRAIGTSTAFVLKVHPSNFRVEGFTAAVPVDALAQLARSRGVPLVVDIGSGLLTPHPRLPDEPDADTVLTAGASLVTCSGDKLLGGPQSGLLLGTAELVQRLRSHPFARAVRADKLTLAALEATLTGPLPPVGRMLATGPEELARRARSLADAIGQGDVVTSQGAVGGGGAPGVVLPSWAVALPQEIAPGLRRSDPPVVGRVHEGRLLLDVLAMDADEVGPVAAAVRKVLADRSGQEG